MPFTKTPAQVLDAGASEKGELITLLDEIIADTSRGNIALRHRPGDRPDRFDLGGAVVVTGPYGKAVRASDSLTVRTSGAVALEAGQRLEFLVSYYRTTNSADPANDGVTVGVDYFNNQNVAISSVTFATDVTLTIATGRKVVSRAIALTSSVVGDVVAPAGTVYAKAWVRFFGTDHVTESDGLMLRRMAPASAVAAPFVQIPTAFQWPPETIPDYSVERVFYVSQGGNDANNGESLRKPVRNIERARDLVAASPDPATIMVYPGLYATSGHIDIPDNCTGIRGTGAARSTRIVPSAGNEEKNVFRLGDGGYVEGFSFEGFRVDDLDDPSEGFAIAFRPGAIIRRSVYAHNITVWRGGPPTLIEPPLDRANGNPLVGRGAGVAIADRAVVSGYSVFPQIMLWGATPVSPNGIGYLAKNGGFINGINAVALWMHKQYMCLSGGKMILTNCASQFGDYTLWAEGSRLEVRAGTTAGPLTVEATASAAVIAATTAIINAMWTATNAAYPGLDETNTRTSAAIFMQAIAFDFAAGQQESSQTYVEGLFDYKGDAVFSVPQKPAFLFAISNMRNQIKALAGVGAAADTMMDGLYTMIEATINTPVKRTVSSEITAVGHQWNNVMAGVNRRALRRPSLEVPDSIIERALGRITYSGIDDQGKFYFTGGALVNPLTGQFEGPPVDRTILPRARRAATIVGGYT